MMKATRPELVLKQDKDVVQEVIEAIEEILKAAVEVRNILITT